jgi:hypothetical protein
MMVYDIGANWFIVIGSMLGKLCLYFPSLLRFHLFMKLLCSSARPWAVLLRRWNTFLRTRFRRKYVRHWVKYFRKGAHFNAIAATQVHSSLLSISVGALFLPVVFHFSLSGAADTIEVGQRAGILSMSRGVSLSNVESFLRLIPANLPALGLHHTFIRCVSNATRCSRFSHHSRIVYVAYMVFQLWSHTHLYHDRHNKKSPSFSLKEPKNLPESQRTSIDSDRRPPTELPTQIAECQEATAAVTPQPQVSLTLTILLLVLVTVVSPSQRCLHAQYTIFDTHFLNDFRLPPLLQIRLLSP